MATDTRRMKRHADNDESQNHHEECIKRMKKSVESSLQQYLCCISHELPIRPVTGLDGEIYERSEIEKWIQTRKDKGLDITSPATNEVMGETLIPSQRVYNAIEALIQENDCDSEIAKSWSKRVKQIEDDKKFVAETRAKAEAGYGDAMYQMGTWYNHGRRGLPVDREVAAQWYKKSSDVYNPKGMAARGTDLIWGAGNVTKNPVEGAMLLGRAAGEGCDYAFYLLGRLYRFGHNGFPKDVEKTKDYWGRIVNERGFKYPILSASITEEVKKWWNENVEARD